MRPRLDCVALLAAGAVATGCGVGGGGDGRTPADKRSAKAKPGGSLTYLWSGDVDYLDPGLTYYAAGWEVSFAVNRRLYAQRPDGTVVPDLAEGDPLVSGDQRTITIKVRPGIRYAPPLAREVTAADIEYAFERAFSANVTNGYARSYFAEIAGVPEAPGKIQDLPGVEAPDDRTLVLELSKPVAGRVVAALALPITTPVPREYAARHDRKRPSTYDAHVAFSGPYMVSADAEGETTGRRPGRSIELVRNPNWDRATDFRPAYLGSITIRQGNDDTTVAARRALSGDSTVCCDTGAPPASVLRTALQRTPDQLAKVSAGAIRYVSLNTTVKPLDNLNVRRAIVAGADRDFFRAKAGGAVRGPIAQGYIPPGVAGFEQSGGEKGFTDLDFMRNPKGDAELAKRYMLAAREEGVPVSADGRYAGDEELLMIANSSHAGQEFAEAVAIGLRELGLKIKVRAVPQDAVYTKFCGVPKADVAICPDVGWIKDFADAESILVPTFSGDRIRPLGNTNYSELRVQEVDDLIARAAAMPAGETRAQAWADANRAIVEQAPAIPWLWDQTILAHSSDVQPVMNRGWGFLDFTFTSLR